MARSKRLRYWPWALAVALLAIAALLGPSYLAKLVRERSLQLMQQAAGPGGNVQIGSVMIELLPGNVAWDDVRIESDTTLQDRFQLHGHVGHLAVKGLSLWKLLVRNRVHVHSLLLQGADIELVTGKPPGGSSARKDNEGPEYLRVDSVILGQVAFRWKNRDENKPGLALRKGNVGITGLYIHLADRNTPQPWTFGAAYMNLDSVATALPPLYDLQLARLQLAHGDSLLQLQGVKLTSRKGPAQYGQLIPYEDDLINFNTDSITLHGLDLHALVLEHALQAGELRIGRTALHDFRDKTLPDQPFRNKPMPARLLRQLPISVCLDSLVVQHLDVDYHEKDTVSNRYGQVDFTGIQAVIHGICTRHPEKNPQMRLNARAMVYGNAPIRFQFITSIFDSSDHFSANASIGPLPFEAFNAMTNNLILARATAGQIKSIEYTLEANNIQGHGRVDMEYDGLKVVLLKHDGTKRENKLKSFLLNTLLHGNNLKENNGFRHGDYTVVRKQDRQVFNYLWGGLREGVVATVMPQAVLDVKDAVKGSKPK